ncbi:hypothetical protein E2C01_076798 [Portunus trituberculatus]|uniref:Uncharacterized protein n=1 Tax=Portunus trituberculatus TaxID=210409 RepID=A0A5B7IE50_PORTR|nr:hypothetical protein [Portunus trituberculatus]
MARECGLKFDGWMKSEDVKTMEGLMILWRLDVEQIATVKRVDSVRMTKVVRGLSSTRLKDNTSPKTTVIQ